MADDIISNSKTWFTLTPEQQKAVTQIDFEERFKSGKNELYNRASPATRAKIEQIHSQIISDEAYNSEYNPSVQRRIANQAEADDSGPFRNTITKIGESFKDALGRIPMTFDAMNPDGKVNDKLAERAARHFERQDEKIVTEEQKEVQSVLATAEKEIDKAGGFWTAGGLKAAAATIPQLAANPWGVIQVGADSSASMAVMGAGALAGGVAAGPVGSAVGMFATETADAANYKFLEIARERLKAQGLPPTETNLNQLFQDSAFVKAAQITSDKYAATLAATDVVTGAAVGRLATAPARAALKAARDTVASTDNAILATAARARNLPVEAFVEGEVNKIASATLKAQSFKAKLGYVTANYAGAITSEPVSEAAAKTAIDEKVTFTDLMNETLGGIGMGPIEASINKAAFGTKIAGAAIVDIAKAVINSTPETKAAATEHKAAMAEVSNLAKTEAVHDYDNKIAAITPDSEEFKNLSDPTNKQTYNPIAAMDALIGTEKIRKAVDPEIHSQALKVADDYFAKFEETSNQLEAIKAKGENVTPAEVALAKQLEERGKKEFAIVEKLYKRVEVITTQLNNTKAKPTPIDIVQDKPEVVLAKLGSHGTGNKDTLPLAQVDELLKREDIKSDPNAVSSLTTYKTAKTLREKIETQQQTLSNMPKTMKEVSNDIYHGMRGMDFKGIDAYQEGIKHFLNPKSNNPTKATAELDGLRKFSDTLQTKADVAEAVFQSMSENKEYVPTPEQQAVLDFHGLDIHPIVSKNLVPQIRMEADAIKSEVALAEATYKRLSPSTYTSTSTQTQTAPTKPVAKPKVTPVATATPVKPVNPKTPAKPVVATPPATNTGVESKPASDVTQTTTPSVASRLNKLIKDTESGNTSPKGLEEFRALYKEAKDKGAIESVLTRIENYGKEYTAVHMAKAGKTKVETVKPESSTAPETVSKPEVIVAPAPTEVVVPTERKPRKPRKPVKPLRNLFTDIRKLGGVTRETLMKAIDENIIMGRDRNGKRVNLYRRISNKESTFGLDQLAEAMRSEGWQIPVDDYGKAELQPFLDMIVAHKNGDPAVHPDDVERIIARQELKRLKEMRAEFKAMKAEEEIIDDIHEYDDNADDTQETGYDEGEINRVLEELSQEDATREAQGLSGDAGEASSSDVGEVRGESTVATNEIVVDNFAEYDIDYGNLEITYTNAQGEQVTQSYDDAIAQLELEQEQAEAVLNCVNKK